MILKGINPLDSIVTGARLNEAYDVTTERYRNSHAKIQDSKKTYFVVYGFQLLCKISKVPLEISQKIWKPYAVNYAFRRC